MKSILIIGMGKFGHYICDELLSYGNNVMIVDKDESRVADMIYKVTNVQIGDCTDPAVVKSLGVKNFDLVLVCIGTNFQSSLEVTWLVKEEGAKYVVSKANKDVHARFLLRNGADEIIYPDRDIAERLARSYTADSIFDYIELDDGYSIYEIAVLPEWVGHSLRELDLRRRHEINVVGIKQDGKMNIVPPVDYNFTAEDRMMIVGSDKSVAKLLHLKEQNLDKDQFWKKGRKRI